MATPSRRAQKRHQSGLLFKMSHAIAYSSNWPSRSLYACRMSICSCMRRKIAIGFVVSLLFSQWAVAAYVCPSLSNALAMAATTSDGDDATMANCPGMKVGAEDVDAPLICKAHCEQSQHAFDKTVFSMAVALSSPMLVGQLDWRPSRELACGLACGPTQPSATGPPPGWPPLFLSILVLRN